MSMEPPISVCLPVYNGERFLSIAIESILAQTRSDFELIICDDASTDGSADIIRRYAGEDSRVLPWYNQSRCGLFQNYNECIKRASGKYIKPFAQDDWLASTALARLTSVLEKYPNVSLVSARRTIVDDQGKTTALSADTPAFDDYFPPSKPVVGRAVIRESLLPLTNFIGEPSTVMFRRGPIKSFDAGLYHLGDLDLWLRLLIDGDMYFIPDSLCKFRTHASSESKFNTTTLLFWLDYLKIGRKFAATLKLIGSGEAEYLRKNLQAMAHHTELMEGGIGEIVLALRRQHETMLKMYRQDDSSASQCLEAILTDLMGYRELAFLALSSLHQPLEHHLDSFAAPEISGPPMRRKRKTEQYYVLVHHNEKLIPQLEARTCRLLSSLSWRLTKPLRDLNRMLGLGFSDSNIIKMREFEKHVKQAKSNDGLTFQRLYISYLKQQIACIRRSRSWRYTKSIRRLRDSLPHSNEQKLRAHRFTSQVS